jgi:hypothetical protein
MASFISPIRYDYNCNRGLFQAILKGNISQPKPGGFVLYICMVCKYNEGAKISK